MSVILQRFKEDKNQSSGILMIKDSEDWLLYANPCMERGDRNNQRNVSNIPPGIYPLVWEWSPKFKCYLWELKQVPNRSEAKIHSAKFWYHLEGCIAPGYYLTDLNKDGYQDLAYSKQALKIFHRVMKREYLDKGITKTTIEVIDPIEGLKF